MFVFVSSNFETKIPTPSFGGLYNPAIPCHCVLFFVFIKRGLRRGGAVPVEGSIIELSFHSHVLLVEPEDQER